MVKSVLVSPSSGDKTASIFSSGDASSSIVSTVNSGDILKVVGSSGNFYRVSLSTPNEPARGGTSMNATIAATPYCNSYETINRQVIAGNFNNGTTVEIIDDTTNEYIYKVKGKSTQGIIESWVETKFIIRDTDPEPVMMSKSVSQSRSSSTVGKGNINVSRMNILSAPNTGASPLASITSGSSLDIISSNNGWYKVSVTIRDSVVEGYIETQYVNVVGRDVNGIISKSDVKPQLDINDLFQNAFNPVNTGALSESDNYKLISEYSVFGDIYASNSNLANDEYYLKLAEKYIYALGGPPKYNMDIDPQYTNDVFPGIGRAFQKSIVANASYLSLAPGRVEMFPDLISSTKDKLVETWTELLSGSANTATGGTGGLLNKINEDTAGGISNKIFAFYSDTANYANYLNTLCRASAIMLGIGGEILQGAGQRHDLFDYTYWGMRKYFVPGEAIDADPASGMFTNFWGGAFSGGISGIINSAIDDINYINFFLDAAETSVSESITTTIEDSPLQSTFDGVSRLGAQLNYFTGSGFNLALDEADAYYTAAFGSGEGIENLASLASNILKGGRMILPKMVSNSEFGRSVTFNLKFASPYGDKRSIFYKCIVPVCHLLAFALPKQVSDNMYTFPFIVRGGQLGIAHFDIGVITNIAITRGGSDESSYTVDKLATEWNVQLELTSLVDDLMITNLKNPALFLKNEGLLGYLSNICGFDMLANNAEAKLQFGVVAGFTKLYDIPESIEHKMVDSVQKVVGDWFRLGTIF